MLLSASTVSFAGCVGSEGGAGDDTDTSPDGDTNTSDETGTTQSLQDQLGTVRSATEQYEDPQVAIEDGYQLNGPYVPGMGWHFTNMEHTQRAAEEGISLENPPVLTYLDNDDTDGLQLATAEFSVPKSGVSETPDLFNDDDADATEEWHTHEAATHVFAKPDGKQTSPENIAFEDLKTKNNWVEFTPPDEDLAAGDTVSLNWGTAHGKEGETTERVADIVTTHPDLRTLHVWVHTDNPDGVFAPVHPEYTGGHGH